MPGPHHSRSYHNQNNHHNKSFVEQKEDFGTMHKGCWYPPQSSQEPAQFPNQPFPNPGPQGPFFVPAFPAPYGMPQAVMPPNGNHNGNQMPVMQVVMVQGMPPGMGLPPNFDPTTMPMPGMIAKVQPGMPGMPPLPPMDPGMSAVPFPLPPNTLGQPGNYIAGTFMEDQIPHQTEPTADAEKKVEYFNSQAQQDMLPEALRNLSLSPSQSELSCNSTSAYEESPAGSDSDNAAPVTADSNGSSLPTSPVGRDVEAEDQIASYEQTQFREYPVQQQQHPVHRESAPRPFDKRKEQMGERQGAGYNRNGMRTGRRGGYQGLAPRGPPNRRMAPNGYQARPHPGSKVEEDGEWQTVERSGPKQRSGPRQGPRPAHR